MATFYYNSGLKTGIITQWVEHLKTESYIKDFDRIITNNRKEIESTYINSSKQQKEVIDRVIGKLDKVNFNLESINRNLNELRGEINEMASMLDWKLSQMIEEQRLTNQLLGKISQLLRVPDSQKQRVYHIEAGLKYLKNAIIENDINSSYYINAYDELKKAEKIEEKDYVTLNKIGHIHLYSGKYMDISLAEKYFLKSARESFAESNVGGTTTNNNFNPNNTFVSTSNTDLPVNINNKIFQLCKNRQSLEAVKLYSSQNNVSLKVAKHYIDTVVRPRIELGKPLNDYLIATAESYLYAGRACYLQHKIEKAIEYSKKAYSLIPEFLEAGYEYAKYLAVNNRINESVILLKKIINSDRNYSQKVIKDNDLFSKNEIQSLLIELQENAISIANKEFGILKEKISDNSNAKNIVKQIEDSINERTFLSVMNAIDIISNKHNLNLNYYKQESYNSIRVMTKSHNIRLKDFIQDEIDSKKELDRIKEKVYIDLKKVYIQNGLIFGSAFGFFVVNIFVKIFYPLSTSLALINTIVFALIGIYIAISIDKKIKIIKD